MKKYHKDGIEFSVETSNDGDKNLIDTLFIKGSSGGFIHKSVRYAKGSTPNPKHVEVACASIIEVRDARKRRNNKKGK